SLYVFRITPGVFIKPHFHKTHDESIYFIKGPAQMLINIGIGLPITEEPSHTTWHTDRYLGGSADQAD
ncbi:MAG: hypothetical protein Q7J27_12300, partial [Syntrophales bacterium]|nr:hypothetical protein [Syntrophales bacterium]